MDPVMPLELDPGQQMDLNRSCNKRLTVLTTNEGAATGATLAAHQSMPAPLRGLEPPSGRPGRCP